MPCHTVFVGGVLYAIGLCHDILQCFGAFLHVFFENFRDISGVFNKINQIIHRCNILTRFGHEIPIFGIISFKIYFSTGK